MGGLGIVETCFLARNWGLGAGGQCCLVRAKGSRHQRLPVVPHRADFCLAGYRYVLSLRQSSPWHSFTYLLWIEVDKTANKSLHGVEPIKTISFKVLISTPVLYGDGSPSKPSSYKSRHRNFHTHISSGAAAVYWL